MNVEKDRYPLITVLSVTYQKLEYIYKLIDSVLAQDYKQIELIISDDGTENFEKEKIEEYISNNKNENIIYKVIHHEHNVGLVRNMNNAIKNSNGEILVVLSGDDQFYNNHAVSDIFSEMSKKQIDFLVTGAILCDSELNSLSEYPLNKYRKEINSLNTAHKQLMKHIVGMDFSMAPGSMWSYTRKLYDEMQGFDESYDLYEDGPFVAKITSLGYKVCTNYEITTRFIRTGGISGNPTNQRMKKDLNLYHSKWLIRYDICENNYEINRLKYWNKILSLDDRLRKFFMCILHPIYTCEYIRYFYIRRFKRNY